MSQEALLMLVGDREKFQKLEAAMARLHRMNATTREIDDDPVAWLEKGCWVCTVDMTKVNKYSLLHLTCWEIHDRMQKEAV